MSFITYFRFGDKKKPDYKKSSKYGGFRMNIDEYYKQEKNRRKLEEINKSTFPKIVEQEEYQEKIEA